MITNTSSNRNCNGCTACCDGWLAGKVNEHYFYPGKKCYYVTENGCSIYDDRPENPCKNFRCGWIIDKEVPEWMKPSTIQAMIIFEQTNKEAPLETIAWFKRLYNQGKIKKGDNQSEEDFLIEIKETIKKYGKYLFLLNQEPISKNHVEYAKIKVNQVQNKMNN